MLLFWASSQPLKRGGAALEPWVSRHPTRIWPGGQLDQRLRSLDQVVIKTRRIACERARVRLAARFCCPEPAVEMAGGRVERELRTRLISVAKRLRFIIGNVVSPEDEVALWVVSLSMALNDLRIAARYATRPDQPSYERLYFVRVLASHLREAVKIVVLGPRDRAAIGQFVASMPQETQNRLREVNAAIESLLPAQEGVTLFDEIKRLRDLTFHYARDARSREQLRDAISRASGDRGTYLVSDRALRAEYADVIADYLVHPFDGTLSEREQVVREMHEAIVALIYPMSDLMHAVEAHFLGRPEARSNASIES